MNYKSETKWQKAARAYSGTPAAIAKRLKHAAVLVQVNRECMQRFPVLTPAIVYEVLRWQEARIKELS